LLSGFTARFRVDVSFCCECDLSKCVSFLVKHCVVRKPLSFSRVALVCGIAERVHLVQQGYCADSVTRLFSESFPLLLWQDERIHGK